MVVVLADCMKPVAVVAVVAQALKMAGLVERQALVAAYPVKMLVVRRLQ
jgi:hypothetical protein